MTRALCGGGGGVVIANVEVLRSKSAEPRKWPDRNRVWLVSATTATGISRDQNTEKKHLKRRDETSLRESSIGTPWIFMLFLIWGFGPIRTTTFGVLFSDSELCRRQVSTCARTGASDFQSFNTGHHQSTNLHPAPAARWCLLGYSNDVSYRLGLYSTR